MLDRIDERVAADTLDGIRQIPGFERNQAMFSNQGSLRGRAFRRLQARNQSS